MAREFADEGIPIPESWGNKGYDKVCGFANPIGEDLDCTETDDAFHYRNKRGVLVGIVSKKALEKKMFDTDDHEQGDSTIVVCRKPIEGGTR